MNSIGRFFGWLTHSAVFWGAVAAVGFYALIDLGPLDYALVRRYCTGHLVEYLEVLLFAIGLAMLGLKMLDALGQRWRLAQPLPEPGDETDVKQRARGWLERLAALPAPLSGDALPRRLCRAMEFVAARGSTEGLDDEQKYWSETEAAASHAGYALFRVIVWAIPILGFLGTVLGITVALNSIDLAAPEKSMAEVLGGLGLKFDTTALALVLSMLLMFLHYFVERFETRLRDEVDRRAARLLAERFPSLPAGPDGQLLVVRRMAETMVAAAERLVERQTELWRSAIDAAAVRWTEMAAAAGATLTESVERGLGDSLAKARIETAASLAELQQTAMRQVEVLENAVRAAGEVASLERALNENLAALAGAKHFEQTITSLAAAVHLLTARLSDAAPPQPIRLEPSRKAARAA